MKSFKLWLVGICASMLFFGCSEEKSDKKDDAVIKAAPEEKQADIVKKEVEVAPGTKEIKVTPEGKKAEVEAAKTIKDITSGKGKNPFAPAPGKMPQGMTLKEFFEAQNLPEVVAVVGDGKITKEQLIKEIQNQLPAPMRNQPLPPQVTAGLAQNLKMVIETIISRKLLLQMAAADGVKPSPRLLLDKFNDFLAKMPPEQKAAFEKQLEAQGTSVAKQKADAMKDTGAQEAVAIDKWIETKLMPKINITEADAKKFYHENQQEFKRPGTVKVAHILIAPEKPDKEKYAKMTDEEKKAYMSDANKKAKAKADEILARVKKGEDFATLAKENSVCPSGKADGGNLPEFDKNGITPGSGPRGGRMDKIFTEASFKLKPGEFTQEPVKTPFGYHIIKSEKKTEDSFVPFDKVKDLLITKMKREKLRKEIKAMIEAEKEKSKVKVFI